MLIESKDSSHDQLSNTLSSPVKARIVVRRALILFAYILAFIFLDSRSRALQVFPGIVAWYPPDGLSFALLLTFGAPFLPVIAITSVVSSYFVFQLPQPFLVLVGWAILIPLAYGTAVWFLRRHVRIDLQLGNTRDLFWMLFAGGIVSTLLATISVSVATANGDIPQAEQFWATVQWWTGEMIGILIVTPVMLIHIMPAVKRFAEGEALLKNIQLSFKVPSALVIMQALSIVVAIYLAVDVNWPNDFHPFFLMAIPLIWIAIQHGLPGASIGNILVNFGLTWALLGHPHFDLVELGQLQLLMLVISTTSLLIGIMASERKQSLRSPITEVERQKNKIIYELIVISIVAMVTWVLEYTFDFYEAITVWETRYQVRGVKETLMTILILGLASAVFSYRRWKETQDEIREREKAQAELHTLYLELEARVQERTVDLSKANELLQAEIAERKQIETALENTEAKYRTLVEQLPAITYIVEFGDHTDPTYISPQIESILGFSAQEWLANPNLWVEQLYPEDRESVLAEFAIRDKLRQPVDVDYRILTRDGRVRWIHDQSELVLDEAGQPRYGHGLLFDITERKQAEEASMHYAIELERRVEERTLDLSNVNTELEHANRVKDEFLTTMSHELRTPLNSILGLSESLLEQIPDPLSERQQRFLQTIEASGRHLLQLINDILDLSKIEAGMLDYYPEVIGVDELCRSSLAFVREPAARKSITLPYQQTATGLKIYADPRRLKQILVNLLTNAVKFTPNQGLVILQVQADAEQDRIEFAVSDNGIGIAPQDLQKLFQPFVQVDTKLNRMFEGTGLGLTLVQKLTDLHGGSVNVESEEGKGSRFMINLPWGREFIAQHEAGMAGETASTSRQVSELYVASEKPLDRGVILLAEDTMANILTIAEYLESHNYQVVVAHDGLEAIQKAGEVQPKIILMDIQMPVMDGMEAITRLRADPRFGSTPIIALTALAMPGDRERCLLAGANEYMSKPVSLKLLAKTISQMLNQKT